MTSDEIYKRIIIMDSMKDANAFMKSNEITKSDLNKLFKKYDIFVEPNASKEEMITKFLNATLGTKLRKKKINKYNTK
jgi:hypothetical protein